MKPSFFNAIFELQKSYNTRLFFDLTFFNIETSAFVIQISFIWY